MINIQRKKDCCGCTACMNICPKKAILMIEDSEGFKYPMIDKSKCIDCGLCNKVCPIINSNNIKNKKPLVYAVKHKNDEIRINSTSGGMFTALSDYILENDGVIYGVIFDDQMKVVHSKLVTKGQRDLARGSKYVQSDLKEIFKDIKKDLLSKKLVLFTGTPCQNAGLKKYLNKDYENLYLCDIVCHGTPSPLLWKERVCKLKMKNYLFRDKVNGWHTHTETIIYDEKRDNKSTISKVGKELFYSHLILRPSCHSCPFTSIERVSDITIADFWGIEKSMPEFDDNKGTSLVLINTNKGKDLFNKIRSSIIYKKSNIKNCLQPQLQYPSTPNKKRIMFWKDYNKYGYEYILKKYTSYGFKNKFIKLIKKVILKILPKKIIKKLLKK